MSEVWVIAEQRSGKLQRVTLELLSKANELARALNGKSGIILLGESMTQAGEELTQYADIVYMVDHPLLKLYQSSLYADIVANLIKEYQPSIVLSGSTILGQELAARVAAKLNTGLTAHCIDLYFNKNNNDELIQVVPGWGGNLMVNIACPIRRPQMATVSPGIMEICVRRQQKGQLIQREMTAKQDSRIETLEISEDIRTDTPMEEAEIIVSGGWGMNAIENFEPIKQLARILGGAVAGTRPVYDRGWIDKRQMVGQSGTTVSPKLFISIGASGAPQYTIGFMKAKVILAVDQNPKAPIFDAADIGLVGDVRRIMPALIKSFQQSACAIENINL